MTKERAIKRIERLQSLECGLGFNRDRMIRIGNALRVIRDEHLYREVGCKNFEKYLRLRIRDDFGIDVKDAKRCINFATIVELLNDSNADIGV